MVRKTRAVIRGDTVYEIDVRSKKPRHIVHGVDKYFQMKRADEEGEDYDEEEYEEEEEYESPRTSPQRRLEILKVMGRRKKLTTKADGLDKDIPISERHKKKSKSPKRKKKTKGCGCK